FRSIERQVWLKKAERKEKRPVRILEPAKV
ncbi:unnamed protein product, partial [marine sediment metagenome]